MNEGWLVTVQWSDDPEQRPIVRGGGGTLVRFRGGDEKTDIGNQAGQPNHAVERHQSHARFVRRLWFGLAMQARCLVVAMTHEELLLLTELKRICDKAGPFSQHFPDNGLSIAAEVAYGQQLIELGEGILRHATARQRMVIDGETTGNVMEPPHRELPPGSEADEWRSLG